MTTLVQETTYPYQYLVEQPLWDRLVARIMKDHDRSREQAEAIMNEALGFLYLAAHFAEDGPFSPSAEVDLGWHTFLLYTREYAAFCHAVAGRFIHHSPSDEEGAEYAGTPQQTAAAMERRGLTVNPALWGSSASCENHCGHCKSEAHCWQD